MAAAASEVTVYAARTIRLAAMVNSLASSSYSSRPDSLFMILERVHGARSIACMSSSNNDRMLTIYVSYTYTINACMYVRVYTVITASIDRSLSDVVDACQIDPTHRSERQDHLKVEDLHCLAIVVL